MFCNLSCLNFFSAMEVIMMHFSFPIKKHIFVLLKYVCVNPQIQFINWPINPLKKALLQNWNCICGIYRQSRVVKVIFFLI